MVYLFTLFISLSILPAQATMIVLQGEVLKNRVAIPFELVRSHQTKPQELESYAKSQAQLECMSHLCGATPCAHVVEQKHVRRLAQTGAVLRTVKANGESEIHSRDWPFSITDEEVYEDYFQSITCSDDPSDLIKEITNSKKMQIELNPSCRFCNSEIESPESKSKKRKLGDDSSLYGGMKRLADGMPAYKRLKEFGYNALCLGGPLAIQGAVTYLSTPSINDNAISYICKSAFQASGMPAQITKKISEFVGEKRDEMMPEFLLDGPAKEKFLAQKRFKLVEEKFKELEQENRILKDNSSFIVDALKGVDRGFANLRKPRNEQMHYSQDGTPVNLPDIQKQLDRIEKVLQLPSEVKKLDPATVKEQIQFLTRDMNTDIGRRIEKITRNIAVGSHTTEPSKSVIYFYGHPGTGKSYLAKGIAQSLDVPFLSTRISEGGTFSKELDDFLSDPKNKYKNSIIYLDEAGDFLGNASGSADPNRNYMLSTFKTLLDSENHKMPNNTLSIGINGRHELIYHDLSKVTFILTGNHPIEDKALASRMETITFPKVALQERTKIAQLIWKKETKDGVINAQDDSIIKEIINKTDQKFDGVREMKALIHDYVTSKVDHEIVFSVDKELENYENARTTPSSSEKQKAP